MEEWQREVAKRLEVPVVEQEKTYPLYEGVDYKADTSKCEVLSVTKIEKPKGLRLNVGFNLGDNFLIVPGFRWVGGCIDVPSHGVKGKWYKAVFMDRGLAESLYAEVKRTLTYKGLIEEYPLNSLETVCEVLVDKRGLASCIPSLAGTL